MAKTKISEFSTTAADNTDITNINIAEGCSPANLNNAVRLLPTGEMGAVFLGFSPFRPLADAP